MGCVEVGWGVLGVWVRSGLVGGAEGFGRSTRTSRGPGGPSKADFEHNCDNSVALRIMTPRILTQTHTHLIPMLLTARAMK